MFSGSFNRHCCRCSLVIILILFDSLTKGRMWVFIVLRALNFKTVGIFIFYSTDWNFILIFSVWSLRFVAFLRCKLYPVILKEKSSTWWYFFFKLKIYLTYISLTQDHMHGGLNVQQTCYLNQMLNWLNLSLEWRVDCIKLRLIKDSNSVESLKIISSQ